MNADSLWQPPAHWVIAAPLEMIQEYSMPSLKALLSGEEQLRTERFRRRADQQRYVLAHGLKRFCLARILGVEPKSLPFGLGDKGKPFCDYSGAPDFNLSHSGDWVLLGVSSIAEIGVDVEMLSREVSESVKRYALTPSQLEQVKNDDEPEKRFMLYWTQKEAISKALGLGLTIEFQTVQCSGKEKASQVEHSNNRLMVGSRMLEDYLVSVACAAPKEPQFYRLVSWKASELLLKPMPNTL